MSSKPLRWFLLPLILLAGCATSRDVYKNYDSKVTPGQGVSSEQAKIVAQKKLLNTIDKERYRLSYPDIKTGEVVKKYPDYWFVVFGHNWLEPMSKYPMAWTYKQLRETEFLVVIDKKTGEIPFFGEWYPKRENDFDWVFDRHAYNRKDPLALPPYEQSKDVY
jgi:hypothetical protein